jgi:hypothetical protein
MLARPPAGHGGDAEDGHGHGQQPGAQAPAVAHVDPVGDGPHGAEVGLVGHGAHDHGGDEDGRQHLVVDREFHASSSMRALVPGRDQRILMKPPGRWISLVSPYITGVNFSFQAVR